MSEIRVTTLKDTSGGNSSTTTQIASGRAKAFVNFNGASTVAIRAQFNVNSITDNGTGDYTVNYSSALADGNYTVAGSTTGTSNADAAGTFQLYGSISGGPVTKSTSATRVTYGQSNTGGAQDRVECNFVTFR